VKERKYPGRFTVQFNTEDPQQRTAAEVLGQQGRRKAQFLTSAILQYVKHSNGPDRPAPPISMDIDVLKRMVREILQSDPQFSTSEHKAQRCIQSDSGDPAISWDEPVSDGVIAAMSNTLAAFRSK